MLAWGAHFPLTATDAQSAATAVRTAIDGGTLSRAAGARYVARYFGVEDVVADQELVVADEKRQDQRLYDVGARQRYAGGLDESTCGSERPSARRQRCQTRAGRGDESPYHRSRHAHLHASR